MICFFILLMSKKKFIYKTLKKKLFKFLFKTLLIRVDEDSFKQMQDTQKLCINFKDYSNLCKKLFNNCINEPQR